MGLTSNPERTSKVIEILMDWYSGKDGKREGLMSGVGSDISDAHRLKICRKEVMNILCGLLLPSPSIICVTLLPCGIQPN